MRPALLALMLCTASAAAAELQVIGYLPQWGVYSRGDLIKGLEASGAAARLNELVYAFAAIGADYRVVFIDAQADYLHACTAANSIDGMADGDGAGSLRGNFHQLLLLKRRHAGLRVVISIGGWSASERFSGMAGDAGRRKVFVASVSDRLIAGNLAPGVTAPELFDGIDIDWEYPATPRDGVPARAEDSRSFTELLAELRTELDRQGAARGRRYVLSAALPAPTAIAGRLELGRIHAYLDALHLMTYDFHGGWEAITGPLAALHASPNDPAGALQPSVERVVADYRAAGVPAGKLVLGVPFYGRGWQGVEPGPHGDGHYQHAGGPAAGATAAGIDDACVLMARHGATAFRDPASQAFWTYDAVAKVLWSYDDAVAVRAKRAFALSGGMGGVMCWALTGDDAQGTLIRALAGGQAAAPTR